MVSKFVETGVSLCDPKCCGYCAVHVSPFLSLLIILLLSAGAIIVVMAFLIARSMISPPRMNDGKAAYLLHRIAPDDLGLFFDTVQFAVRDEATDGRTTLKMAGWWIPSATTSNRCVIIVHGFADAKVGSIAWAPTWHALGFHILAIDSRAHGESEGRYCTAAFLERHDLSQVIDQLRLNRPAETRSIVLFGLSLGAAVAIATTTLQADSPISALVLDSSFGDFNRAAINHAKRFGITFKPITTLAIAIAERITRADVDSIRPIDLLQQVKCPVQLIRSSGDRDADPNDFDAMSAAMVRRNNALDDLWIVDNSTHLLALASDPVAYADRIKAFVERVIALSSPGH